MKRNLHLPSPQVQGLSPLYPANKKCKFMDEI